MTNLLDFWFSAKGQTMWFNATKEDDKFITEKFSYMINNSPRKHYFPTNKNKLLEHIIVYDQIVRHVYRDDQNKIQVLSQYALKLSLYILDKKLDLQYLPEERCFILLPLRHTFNLQYVTKAFKKIQEYRENDIVNKYYIRFYRATILSLSKLKTPLIEIEDITSNISNEEICKTLDPICIKNLTEILPINRNEPIYKAFKNTLKKIKGLKELTLSLSGGVDSMISSFVLYHLSKEMKFKFLTNSIDYGNREDHEFEMELIKRWTKLLKVPHYIKHITELSRNRSVDRDLYEKITKVLRFDLYKRFNNPVILGHNQDDCLENIFNNIKKTRSYNNLKGMNEFSEENGCVLVRPMLDITKKQIRKFANKYKIPHLPNSTPDWSERGRIRDELLPFLNEFEPALIPGFLKLAENTKEIYTIYDKSVIEKFYLNSIRFTLDKVIIILNKNSVEKNYGFIFWKDVIFRIILKLGYMKPSNKSILMFVERIKRNSYGKICVIKDIVFEYDENQLILYL